MRQVCQRQSLSNMSDAASKNPASNMVPLDVVTSRGLRRLARWRYEGRAFRALKQMEAEWSIEVAQGQNDSRQRLLRMLRHRPDFRRIIGQEHPAVIRLYLSNCSPEMAPLAIWLWSRCADRFRMYGLAAYCHDPSPHVRKHVAKALRRLEGWSYLRMMAAAYPDDAKMQWFATTPTMRRPFAERLEKFKRRLDDSHADEVATPSQMPFWALDPKWEPSPPKSVEFIRRMLRRIQHWVRWGTA
jgi:hypothetical protein